MDYQKHYVRLVERAKSRTLSGYVEVHHIIPKCMGGGDAQENLVQLTPEEHYVAHQLLHKMYPNVRGLTYALICMTGNPHGKRSNRLYGWIKKVVALETSKLMRQKHTDVDYVAAWKSGMAKLREDPEKMHRIAAAISLAHKGRKKSDVERANIAEARRKAQPRKFSAEARANMAASRKKMWEERRAKGEHLLIGAKVKAKRIENGTYTFTEEHKRNIGLGAKGRTPWNKGVKLSQK